MYNWKDARNYRRFRDENGNVIANIIYVDGEEVAVSDEVYEAYASMDRRERYLTDESDTPQNLSFERCVEDCVPFELLYETAAAVWKKIWRGKKCFVFFTKRFNRSPQRNRNSSVNCSSCIVQHENLRRNMVFHSQPLSSASSVCYRL